MTAHDSRVYSRGSSAVGRRGAVLTSVPKKIVPDSASNDGVAPDRARRRPEVKDVVAEAVLDRDRRLQGLGLGPDVVLPDDLAGLRLQGDDEAPPGAALVAGEGRDDLLERAAGDDQLAVGEDRRGEEDVQRVGPGELLASHAQLPTLLPGRPVQRVDPALQIREEDGVFGDQRRAVDAPSADSWRRTDWITLSSRPASG